MESQRGYGGDSLIVIVLADLSKLTAQDFYRKGLEIRKIFKIKQPMWNKRTKIGKRSNNY